MKIYVAGGFLAVDKEDQTRVKYIPSQDTDFDDLGNGDYLVLNKQRPAEKYKFNFSNLKDKDGNLIGNEADVLEYLITTVNFKPASGGSEAGFMDYNDTTGTVLLAANTWTDIPNNGLGAFTNKTYKPEGITELMDVSTGYIDTTETELGETILIRNDYKVNPNTNNALLEFRYELGNGGGIYTLEKIVGRLDSGSGQDYRFSLEPDLIYMGDTNTKDSPIKLQLKLSTNGTLTNAGSAITLIKR